MEKIYKENEIMSIAKEVIEILRTCNQHGALLVNLKGDLGAGKTTLVQEIARQLNIQETVISPTYVIMKKYQISNDAMFKSLVHIDAYRLNSDDELSRLSWDEIISDSNNLIIMEWPEKVPTLSSSPNISISLTHHNNDSRKMVLVRYTKE